MSFAAAKMTTCQSCETTVFLDGDQVRKAGQSGAMFDAPQLFQVGDTISVAGSTYDVVGHARFDYGPGWWDEYWAIGASGAGVWISVDEGDVIMQHALTEARAPDLKRAPKLGDRIQALGDTYRVTETDRGTCIALRGAFPETLTVGEVFDYINCLNDHGELLSGEFAGQDVAWFQGAWCDPFQIEVKPSQ